MSKRPYSTSKLSQQFIRNTKSYNSTPEFEKKKQMIENTDCVCKCNSIYQHQFKKVKKKNNKTQNHKQN
jgi:hypothetical protein